MMAAFFTPVIDIVVSAGVVVNAYSPQTRLP
jgi:hypothetical protein